MTHLPNRDNQHTISLLVSNKPGVLIRISLCFARRGFNIDSLVVSPSKDEDFSRMTITASGNGAILEQIIRQLNKLVDVIHATDHTGDVVVQRELALLKVSCTAKQRTEVLQISDHFRCDTVDLTPTTLMIQGTGGTEKLDDMVEMLRPYGILEMVRTGKVLMIRGSSET